MKLKPNTMNTLAERLLQSCGRRVMTEANDHAAVREWWVGLPVPDSTFRGNDWSGAAYEWCQGFLDSKRGEAYLAARMQELAPGVDYEYDPDDLNIEGPGECELQVFASLPA